MDQPSNNIFMKVYLDFRFSCGRIQLYYNTTTVRIITRILTYISARLPYYYNNVESSGRDYNALYTFNIVICMTVTGGKKNIHIILDDDEQVNRPK